MTTVAVQYEHIILNGKTILYLDFKCHHYTENILQANLTEIWVANFEFLFFLFIKALQYNQNFVFGSKNCIFNFLINFEEFFYITSKK